MLGNLHYCPFWSMGNLFNTHQHLDLVCILFISWWNNYICILSNWNFLFTLIFSGKKVVMLPTIRYLLERKIKWIQWEHYIDTIFIVTVSEEMTLAGITFTAYDLGGHQMGTYFIYLFTDVSLTIQISNI